jgi:hypothetical protein
MSWRTEWKAISDRIEGLMEAGRFFVQLWVGHSSDTYGTAKRELLPHARSIFQSILKFQEHYSQSLPPTAVASLSRFTQQYKDRFSAQDINEIEGLKLLLPCLASFRSEFTFQLSDMQAVAKRITERAFIHLQRIIIADPNIKEQWGSAFESGETACEKLGAAHLLLHGIWAFKASAEGERTDLILGEPLKDLSQVESTAESLVLTEWKIIRTLDELEIQADKAYRQASVYGSSSLAGFELSGYCYLVLVSKGRLEVPSDRNENGVSYKYINIAVKPQVPSRI